ncbi:hypothetical protein DICVIV_06800 [Dictyocaulus viviparus]|uniref:D-fructose-1,6-bisphosphate 1-phosphohydrolase n=1 Tax=Dictyocaulus viviparus TaxID=29172 RepID=A0A0D8XTP7_DICVI|nr:hypothetical protein DICVIV_06800 [Dictyocaulus viviparus]
MAMILEQAGGVATTGKMRILDIVPTKIHERSPIILGSKEDVEEALEFVRKSPISYVTNYLSSSPKHMDPECT